MTDTDTDPTPAASPLTRLRRSLLHPSRAQLGVAALLGVLMFAAVTQVRLYGQSNAYSGLRQSDLVQALNGLSAASARSDAEISQLERTRDALRNNSEQRTAALAQAQKELTTLGILAGTLPAHGPGLEIVVSDPKGQYRVNHLLDGIEALRDAGAEAMQMNGQVRIVAQTSFEDAEGGIDVDGRLLTPPYTIDVIGDPTTLATALNFPGGFKDDVALDEGTTKVTRKKDVEINVTRTPTNPHYATPQVNQ
ncbi:DUF881 domain-containing protein [Nocardioides terrisoli]|uniref:DUF881 domain-containing protein n=1 Tax=Nocardioides terrisoli TaxID=3388267 RepID=UPI00287BC1F8|nr:DUF881 domain-containing protein [Nocardioides marmorisolisilvae]